MEHEQVPVSGAPPAGGPPQPEEQLPRLGEIEAEERQISVKLIAGLVLVVLFIVFVLQNSERVEVKFIVFDVQIRLIYVFVICALLGMLIAFLVGRPRWQAMKKLVRQMERQRKRDS